MIVNEVIDNDMINFKNIKVKKEGRTTRKIFKSVYI